MHLAHPYANSIATLAVLLLSIGSHSCRGPNGRTQGLLAPAAAQMPKDKSPETGSPIISQDIAHGIDAPLAKKTASSAFWRHWGDGKAEISGYEITTNRYGMARKGTVALIYVTEPMDSRTWIKNDAKPVPKANRVQVMKLNHMLRFQTGIYPYSVMTSVFSPVNSTGRERFAPAKISFSAQEWCGHVYQQIHPKGTGYLDELHSYFESEGNSRGFVKTAPFTLYEDALLIQLRELDGLFANGSDWSGFLVPSLWSTRKTHVPLGPVKAKITRKDTGMNGQPVTQFDLVWGSERRTIYIEKTLPRRVLGWDDNRGEKARLISTARLPYWQLNKNGDESHLTPLGL